MLRFLPAKPAVASASSSITRTTASLVPVPRTTSTSSTSQTRSGFLTPTRVNHFPPLIAALLRAAIPLIPIALEFLSEYMAKRHKQRIRHEEAIRSMREPLTVQEACQILAISDRKQLEGGTTIPFPEGTEARKVASENFAKYFNAVHPSSSSSSSTSSTSQPPPPKYQNDYLAGKISGAYRKLVDENWDGGNKGK